MKSVIEYLANHPRVPEDIRKELSKFGLSADEFSDNGSWPTQIYEREARWTLGEYVMAEHNCRRMHLAKDSVGLASYTMDSQNVQKYITQMECVQNEGNIEVSTGGPYAISYRSLLPKNDECENLLVCCAIPSSHISFGSTRMEPVFMIMGQSAATAVALSLEEGSGLHGFIYSRLRNRLIEDGQILEIDTDLFPPLPPEKEIPLQRRIHPSEPILDNACIVQV